MQHILHTYQLRLTNLSQGNRTLCLSRLSRRRDIDITQLGYLGDESPEQLLLSLLQGKSARLIEKPDPRYEPVALADQRLSHIYRTLTTLSEETGSYDFCLGYPFVEGKFLDGTLVRCPVLLFPVQLVRNLAGRPRWRLTCDPDQPIVFNKTFLLAYERYQQIRLDPAIWDLELAQATDWAEWLHDLYGIIKKFQLEVNVNPRIFDLKLESFPDYQRTYMDTFPTGVLTFRSQAVLGLFPQSDSALLRDYEQIIHTPEAYDLDRLLGGPPMHQPAYPYIREEERFFVTPLDHTQEEALLRIKQGESLVMYGPPGTGKSQVIVNMIADAIAHGKKVLLVSQKRAALDVVYNRMSALGLGRFAVLVHDYRHDRSVIYDKIRQQIDDIEIFRQEIADINITQWEYQYNLVSRQADQFFRTYASLFQALTEPQPCGLNVHSLYLMAGHEVPPLPLEELAKQLDLPQLDAFLGTLETVMDYRELYAAGHPWSERLSFHRYTQDDLIRLRHELQAIPARLAGLHTQYAVLADPLRTHILDPATNRSRIAAFRTADQALMSPQVREDIEALKQADLTPEKGRALLSQFEKPVSQLGQRAWLTDAHWPYVEALAGHIAQYQRLMHHPLRWMSIGFLRARWFIRKLLEPAQSILTPELLKQLADEAAVYLRLQKVYGKYHAHPFTGDFPLLDTQVTRQAWITRKQTALDAWEQISSITYFQKIKPRFESGRLDMQRWQASCAVIQRLEAFTRELEETRQHWGTFLHMSQTDHLLSAVADPGEVQDWLRELIHSFERDAEELRILDTTLAPLSTAARAAIKAIQPELSQHTDPPQVIRQVRQRIIQYWIEQAERTNPVLTEVGTRGWHRTAHAYAQKLDERRQHTVDLIHRRVKERVVGIIQYNRLKNPVTYRTIYHQVTKKRLIWPVRKLVQETWQSGLPELLPCWMVSPEAAAAIFPMEKNFFDLVIFDEASQCFVERAIPVMLRGTQCVIAGDDKQLRPADLYQVRYEEADTAFVENPLALEVESVLDLARAAYPAAHLTWHYRSRDAALIHFSNTCFYDGRLQMIPPARADHRWIPPIEWVSVPGRWESQANVPEAEAVVRLILELVASSPQPSLGVVTFNYVQQELIRDLLDQTLERLNRESPQLGQKLMAAMQRFDQEAFMGLFVKNIENVQGDERDVIIFSTGYAPDDKGRLSAQFGLLNQAGGENRLNVAVSRARQKIYIVCSFMPGDLRVADTLHPGPRLLQQYLAYGYAVSQGLRPAELMQSSPAPEPGVIAAWLAAALTQRGYQVVHALGDTRWRLDMAVRDPADPAQFKLGIECEGAFYFSGASVKEREVYRPALLRDRGWQVYRVWARNFWRNRDKELEQILRLLEA